MLVTHLLCGVLIGVFAGIAGMLAGLPILGVVGASYVGADLGLGASALAVTLRWPRG